MTNEEAKADRLFNNAARRAKKAVNEVATNHRTAQSAFQLIGRLYDHANAAEIRGRSERQKECVDVIESLNAACREAEETARQGRMWINAGKSQRLKREQMKDHRLRRGMLM